MMTHIFGSVIPDSDESASQDECEDENVTMEKSDTDKSRLEAIEYLLKHGAHVNMTHKDGMNLLGIACVHAMVTPEAMDMLLQHSAGVNVIQGNGRVKMSPLNILGLHDTRSFTDEKSDNGEFVRVNVSLESHGARHACLVDYEDRDIEKRTSWSFCCSRCQLVFLWTPVDVAKQRFYVNKTAIYNLRQIKTAEAMEK
jgi:hypothetical protein